MTIDHTSSRRLGSSWLPKLVLACASILGSCREAGCPDGQVALEGACYPADLVQAAGGQVPIVCDPACPAAAPYCDYRTGTCFACRSDDDCSSHAAPVCDPTTRSCEGCEDDDACEPFNQVCDVADAACVQCTLETEALQCGNKTCNLQSNLCTTTDLHSVATCMSCAADHDCGPYMRCVNYEWRAGAPLEQVCLYDRAQGGCQVDDHGYRAPYVNPIHTTTVNGEPIEVCAPPTTCGAARAYVQGKSCTSGADCDDMYWGSGVCSIAPGSGSGRCMMWCRTAVGGNRFPADPCSGTDICDTTYCVRQ